MIGHQLLYIICSFVVSLVCGLVCIPAIIDFCVRRKLYDTTDGRKIHKGNIPRLGGICFLPSMLVAFIMALFGLRSMYEGGQIQMSMWSYIFFVSLLLIYAVGFVDDLIGLDAKTKFVVQILAATLMPLSGLCINNLYGVFGIYQLPVFIGAPLTVFVMVFIINAMNLIDGIDGLAGSLSLLSLGGFLVCFAAEELWLYSILIAGLMGVVSAFLYFNLFGKVEKHRKVFMGDTGSLTLGFILAFLFVKFITDNPNVKPFRIENIILSFTLLIVPVFDVVRVVLVRWKNKKPLFDADKSHIHHKLMRAGLTQHQALAVIVGLAATYIVVNMLLISFCPLWTIFIADIILWLAFQIAINKRIKSLELNTNH